MNSGGLESLETLRAELSARANGCRQIISAAGGADQAARLMVTEQLPKLVEEQVKAVTGLKIDKIPRGEAASPRGHTRTGTAP